MSAAWIAIAEPKIKHWEQFRSEPYWDFGQWSNGYGQHCEKGAAPITEEQASLRLAAYLAGLAARIMPLIKVPVTDNQGAALLMLVYNIGVPAFTKSTLLKRLNAGLHKEAADQFLVWKKSKGKTLPGLVKRRADERALFLS
jgi:lysozyme